MADADCTLRACVCYARPEIQLLRELRVKPGTTVREAIVSSGVLDEMPEISLDEARVGIFGKLKPLDAVVRDGDRIEIYRPLIADPKETRRRRANRSGSKKPVVARAAGES